MTAQQQKLFASSYISKDMDKYKSSGLHHSDYPPLLLKKNCSAWSHSNQSSAQEKKTSSCNLSYIQDRSAQEDCSAQRLSSRSIPLPMVGAILGPLYEGDLNRLHHQGGHHGAVHSTGIPTRKPKHRYVHTIETMGGSICLSCRRLDPAKLAAAK